MRKPPLPSRSCEVCRLRFSIKRQAYILHIGRWDSPEDQRLATRIGLDIYEDYLEGESRRVPLCDATATIFTELCQPHPDALVFPNPEGKPMCRRSLNATWNRHLAKAGLPHIPHYKLRHTFISHQYAAGHQAPTIARITGHSLKTLTTHYLHIDLPQPATVYTPKPLGALEVAHVHTGTLG